MHAQSDTTYHIAHLIPLGRTVQCHTHSAGGTNGRGFEGGARDRYRQPPCGHHEPSQRPRLRQQHTQHASCARQAGSWPSVASTSRCRRAPARAPEWTDEAGSTRMDECMHVPASSLSDALTLKEQRTYACYAGRVRGASEPPPLGRSAAYRLESPKEACGRTNADREMVHTVSGMEARGVQHHVQQRCTVGRGSERNAQDEQRVCMHHLVQLFNERN